MKKNYNKIVFLTIMNLFLLVDTVFSQKTNVTETKLIVTEEIATFCKVWGFLKYFHPHVADGTYNWDEQFVTQLPLLLKIENIGERSLFYLNWINSLGAVEKSKSFNDAIDDSKYFLKNMDFNWLENKAIFNEETINKLLFIKDNRYQKKTFYIEQKNNGSISFINQLPHKNEEFPAEAYRILAFAQYWNSVEYFFPYKYLTTVNWNETLYQMIPKFIDAQNDTQYDLAKRETVVSTDDGHAHFRTLNTDLYFGAFLFPATVKMIEEKAVITSFLNPALAKENDLKIGDIILSSNDGEIENLIDDKLKYVNGSNGSAKLRDNYYYLLNGPSDSVRIVLSRNELNIEEKIKRYPFQSIFTEQLKPTKYKVINNRIGYINMASLEEKDVKQMMKEFQNLKGLIIDLRNYPKFFPYNIASRFIKEKKDFSILTEPDLSFPSRFKFGKAKTVVPSGQYYSGKVIILVNEETQSRAEYSVMLLQTGDNVTTVGSKTAGADGDISSFYFSSNSKSTLSSLGVYYPDKSETQRVGVKIDIEIKPSILGIQTGKDELLEEAITQIDRF